MKFFLGTHHAAWLKDSRVPLFVSRRRMPRRPRWRAACEWAMDSGGFSELTMFGRWQTSAEEYAEEVRRWRRDVGGLAWAAAQDWMCEPQVIAGGPIAGRTSPGTGLSVVEHQRRTVENYLLLRRIAPEVPWTPVLQGYEPHEYIDCLRLYADAGVDLRSLPVVGVGSVCRRQHTGGIGGLFRLLHRAGLKLHGFGLKVTGLPTLSPFCESADSLAWSYAARRRPPLPGCVGHKNCANCRTYALQWRERLLGA